MKFIQDGNRFYSGEDKAHPLAEILFEEPGGGRLVVTHTYTAPELRQASRAGWWSGRRTTRGRRVTGCWPPAPMPAKCWLMKRSATCTRTALPKRGPSRPGPSRRGHPGYRIRRPHTREEMFP